MSDQTLEAQFGAAAGRLDAQERAWAVGIGALTRFSGHFETAELRPVIGRAFDAGDFPSGPFPFTPAQTEFSGDGRGEEAVARFELSSQRQFEYRVGLTPGGLLSVALTRSGRLDDGSVEPSHVLLSDVESVLSDTLVLLECLAGELEYAGPRRLLIGLVSDVPGRPLELRAYDEDGGDALRPAAGYNEFSPIEVEYPGRLDAEQTERLLWETALAISLAFGVFVPQMVGQAKTRTTYSFGELS